VAVIGIVAASPSLAAVLAVGTGGAIGATSAMWAHRRIAK
jgi:ABC-type sugar transport system substrate-binding protein